MKNGQVPHLLVLKTDPLCKFAMRHFSCVPSPLFTQREETEAGIERDETKHQPSLPEVAQPA